MIDIDKERRPLLTGKDLNGKPVALYPGQVARLHLYHEHGCPGGHGRPDLCLCKPEGRIEIISGHPRHF